MPNIKLCYLYRDGDNYKNHGAAIFENPDKILLEEVLQRIKSKLIDETWFYADKWGLQDLHFEKWDNQIDHTFHEFELVEYTSEQQTEIRTIKEFLDNLSG